MADITDWAEGQNAERMLRGVTMAIMLILSQQPQMMYEVSADLRRDFPYECFSFEAHVDEDTGTITFMLIDDTERSC